jgi:protein-serine/threonine kinase
MSKGLCGSEPYIAPEQVSPPHLRALSLTRWQQFEPKATYDARLVDVWALAVVFYCMQVRAPSSRASVN